MTSSTDMSPAEIKCALANVGFSYTDLDTRFGFPTSTTANAAKRADPKGEIAIAAMLGMNPQDIWPSRYGMNGKRLNPQPIRNYKAKPAITKTQNKGHAA